MNKKLYVAQFDLEKLDEQEVNNLSNLSKKFMVVNGFLLITANYGDIPESILRKVRVFADVKADTGKFTPEIKRFLNYDK